MATDFTTQITGYYQTIQYRTPPAAELATYNAALQSGTLTTAQVISGIENSSYTQSYVNAVIREYQAAFGRVPDTAGITYWVGVVSANPTALANLNTIFASSTEFTNRYGATATTASNPALVTALYTNVLGRAPDAAGLAYWSSQNLNASQLLQSFAQSPEFITNTTSFVTAYQNAEAAGTAPTTGSLFSVSGSLPTTNFVFTTGVDNLVGTTGADLFTGSLGGTSPTLQPGDSVNGNGGIDTLKIVDTNAAGATTLAGIGIQNIQNVTVTTVTGAQTYALAGATGVTTVTSLNSSVTDTFTGLAAGTKVVASGAAQTGNINFTMASASSPVSVAVDGGVSGITFQSTTGTETSATIGSTGAANGTKAAPDSFVLTTGGNTITTLAVQADANLIATLNGSDYATTGAALTVSGAATSVNLGTNANFKTIDASGLTAGGLSVGLNSDTTSFKGGTGADTVITNGAALGTGTLIDAGAGTDTLSITAAADLTSTTGAYFKNFEIVNPLGAGTYDLSNLATNNTLTGVSFTTTNAITLNNVTAAEAANITDSAATLNATINVSGATTVGQQDTVTINVNDNATAASTPVISNLNLAGVETVNIVAANSFDTVTVSSLTGATSLTTLKISGAGAASVTSGADALNSNSTIDASSLTGKFTLDISAATTNPIAIKGGVGADTITLQNANISGDIIDLSANTGGKSSITTGTATGNATITLGTHSASDTIHITNGAFEDGGTQALTKISNFTIGSTAATSDVLDFAGAPATLTDGSYSAAATGVTNLTATAASGVITFTGSAAGTATLSQLIGAAEALANTQGANTVEAFQYNGNTYVVEAGTAATVATDHVIQLTGLTGVTSLGTAAAAGAIVFA